MAFDHSSRSSRNVARQIADSRDTLASSEALLREGKPNTFAGRKSQEPFPAEDDPIERADIQNLIHSELQPPK